MLQSMALYITPQSFLGTRIPSTDFSAPPGASSSMRRTRSSPRGNLEILEDFPELLNSEFQDPDNPAPSTQQSTLRSSAPSRRTSGYSDRFGSYDRSRAGSVDYSGEDPGPVEDSESSGDRGSRFNQRKESSTRREVWVNPSGIFAKVQDARRQAEKKESSSTTNKYLWVSPDRKSQPGDVSWPERRTAMLALQTADDVASALERVGGKLESMDLNAVLRRFGRLKKSQEASVLFDWMKTNDKISAPTYTSFFSVLGKAGRAEKALRVFNELPADDAVRSNVYVCNSILSTLVYNGKVDKAFRLFELLKQEGLKPDIITYSTVIAGCAKTREGYSKAKEFILEMQSHGLSRDSVIYGALINVCASHGLEEEARATFGEMLEAGVTPNLFHYSSLLNTYACKGKYAEAEHVLGLIRAAGLTPNLVVYNSLMNAYANSKLPDEARKIFEDVQAEGLQPDTVSYCSMMDAYAKADRVEEAQELFDMMGAKGLKPGSIGYSILISAYARVGQLDGVEKLVAEIDKKKKGECDILLFNTLLKVYCNASYMDGVMATLKKMDSESCTPDRGTFNILIGYFAKEDLCDLALRTLQDMEARGHRPNEATYNALFQGYVKVGKVDEMWDMFATMKKRGIFATNLSLHTVISALLAQGRIDDACATFLDLKASKRALAPPTMEKLIQAFVGAGKMDFAKKALDLMIYGGQKPLQGTWDSVLLKYAELGQYEELLQLLEELKDAGASASASTYAELLKAVSESDEAVKLLNDLTESAPVP